MVQSLVRFAYDHSLADGTRQAIPAHIDISATKRRRLASPIALNLPDPFRVTLGQAWVVDGVVVHPATPGVGWALMDVTTGQDWAWKAVEYHDLTDSRFSWTFGVLAQTGGQDWVEYVDQPEVVVVPVKNVLAATKAYVDALFSTVTAAIAGKLDATALDGAAADLVATPGTELTSAITAKILATPNVPTAYTYDATSGGIKTIVETYPSPIGARTTTYSAWNADGQPTHEVDPTGGAWTLAYDTDGNPTSRTAAV